MSLVLTNALVISGQTVEPSTGTAVGRSPNAFGNVRDRADGAYEPPQTISEQFPAAQGAPMSSAQIPPASVYALKPKFDDVGNSLSVLKVRVDKVSPPATAESVRNRLQLLDSQFRLIGNDLKLSHPETDPMQLLKLQSDIYQMDEELELLTRVVDQATSGIRSLLQTQI
jgi:hypothetical protein